MRELSSPWRAAVVLAVLAVSAAAPAGAAGPAPSPRGTWTTTLRGAEPAFLNGPWTIAFARGGRLTFRHDGAVTARGTWSLSGDRLRIEDRSGPLACTIPSDRGPASYRLRISGGRLLLRAVRDRCGGRETVLTAHALRRA